METEHTTVRLDVDVKRKAEEVAASEHVSPAVVMRRWMRKGKEQEESK
jgi:predicted transcriptional regulator